MASRSRRPPRELTRIGDCPRERPTAIRLRTATRPTTPTGLTAAAAGSTGVNLCSSASTDNVGVTGYIVRRNGVQIATPATRTYADRGLSEGTTYSYTVTDRDAADDAHRPHGGSGRFDRSQPVLECFDRQRRSDRLYRAPQWRPDRDARHDELCRHGFV